MAKAMYDTEFWVPSTFISTKEEGLNDKENDKNGVNAELDAAFGFPSEFPYEFDSFGMEPLNSPVESVEGSTETESSDEDDFFACLTRRLSQSSTHETRRQLSDPICNNDKAEAQKTRVLSGSPQSILGGIDSRSGRRGDRNPNRSSRVQSLPTAPFAAASDAWDAIYAAAGQVARMKISGDVSKYDFENRTLLGSLHGSVSPPIAVKIPTTALFTNQSIAQNFNHQAYQVQQQLVRQEQILKQHCASALGTQAKANWLLQQQQHQQVQNRGCSVEYENVNCGRPLPQSAWPLQVKQNHQVPNCGSGPRDVLQGGSCVKRRCAGTGVFLPRPYGGDLPESRKKTSCAPVLLPAKVIHALNLNMDDLNATGQQRLSSTFAGEYDALLARRNALLRQQKLKLVREEAANCEIRLPQEWTY